MKDYASQWRARATQLQAEREAGQPPPTAEITLDGFQFIGRRLPLDIWIKAGKVPQGLTAQMIRIHRGEQQEINEDDLSTDDLITGHAFVREAITYCVVEPKIVTHTRPLREGEVYYSEVFGARPELVDTLMTWIYAGSPGVPVATEGGETSTEALEHFPDEPAGSAGAEPGAPVPGGGEAVAQAEAA